MIIYLTGSPATGKTTLAERLSDRIDNLIHFRFGNVLTELIQQNHEVTQEALRTSTSHISTPDIVNQVNENAIETCEKHRGVGSVIVDTHAVTTEETGFRVTPMSVAQMKRLNPDAFVCLTARPDVRAIRVKEDAKGRPLLDEEQLRTQSMLQESLVISYAAATGKPAYFMCNETTKDLSRIEAELIALIS
ncbi:ATP-binding protein [uncultured Parasphingopyxis sp.]|uniref:ATP-binding protein n=1 Tax=uncultured Parasphingopyxis sp. TaxID=1547918 RepID=UPI00261FDD6D|nr:ATP-binding protein [uncultured Parasphingopyxis sp.]